MLAPPQPFHAILRLKMSPHFIPQNHHNVHQTGWKLFVGKKIQMNDRRATDCSSATTTGSAATAGLRYKGFWVVAEIP